VTDNTEVGGYHHSGRYAPPLFAVAAEASATRKLLESPTAIRGLDWFGR
jgi:hypothetical protein